jgi:hypothetical protein
MLITKPRLHETEAKHGSETHVLSRPREDTEARWIGTRPQPKRALPQGGTPNPHGGKRPKHVRA